MSNIIKEIIDNVIIDLRHIIYNYSVNTLVNLEKFSSDEMGSRSSDEINSVYEALEPFGYHYIVEMNCDDRYLHSDSEWQRMMNELRNSFIKISKLPKYLSDLVLDQCLEIEDFFGPPRSLMLSAFIQDWKDNNGL